MTEYRLKVYQKRKKVSEDYLFSLAEGLFLMSAKLNNINALEYLDKGTFDETSFPTTNSRYFKRYSVYYEPLDMKLEIVKTSKGDIDKELVINIIKELYKIYERINNRPSK